MTYSLPSPFTRTRWCLGRGIIEQSDQKHARRTSPKCGRYTLKSRAEIIAETFGGHVPPTLPERFNIAPSQLVLAVREKPGSHERELVALKWGLIPFWADDPEIGNKMANPRSETAATKPAFRSSFRARRCLIVADGFYEWQARDGKKQPFYITGCGKPLRAVHRFCRRMVAIESGRVAG